MFDLDTQGSGARDLSKGDFSRPFAKCNVSHSYNPSLSDTTCHNRTLEPQVDPKMERADKKKKCRRTPRVGTRLTTKFPTLGLISNSNVANRGY